MRLQFEAQNGGCHGAVRTCRRR